MVIQFVKSLIKDSGSLLSLIDRLAAVFRNGVKDEIAAKIVEKYLSKNKII